MLYLIVVQCKASLSSRLKFKTSDIDKIQSSIFLKTWAVVAAATE